MTYDIRFNKQRYARYDGPAKEVAKQWLEQIGFSEIAENLGEANKDFSKIWDIKGQHPELGEWRIEAEIKQDWGTKWFDMPFKWPTMDIPTRKRDKTEEQSTHMMVIGGDLKRLFVCSRETMLKSPISVKRVRNRDVPESFYNVPINLDIVKFFFKDKDNKWILYKK